MDPVELKVARIGNSRGVRLPAATLERYRIGERVVMEERGDGILLRPVGGAPPKLSWADTARAMAAAATSQPLQSSAAADGLDQVPWEPARGRRGAGPAAKSRPRRPRTR